MLCGAPPPLPSQCRRCRRVRVHAGGATAGAERQPGPRPKPAGQRWRGHRSHSYLGAAEARAHATPSRGRSTSLTRAHATLLAAPEGQRSGHARRGVRTKEEAPLAPASRLYILQSTPTRVSAARDPRHQRARSGLLLCPRRRGIHAAPRRTLRTAAPGAVPSLPLPRLRTRMPRVEVTAHPSSSPRREAAGPVSLRDGLEVGGRLCRHGRDARVVVVHGVVRCPPADALDALPRRANGE